MKRNRTFQKIGAAMIVMLIAAAGCFLQADTAWAASGPNPPVLKTVKHSGTSLKVTWKKVPGCTGYQIQYADNRLFQKKKSKTITGSNIEARSFSGVSGSGTYYVRIRSYAVKDDKTVYSSWTLSDVLRTNKTMKLTAVRKLLKKFEIRRAAGQKVPGYDTLQGSCYGRGYVYFLLENRNISASKGTCKIVKVKLSNLKVVKVSAPIALCHGNDMTYDTKRNRIVVAHSTPTPKKISVINPNSLKKVSSKTVTLPDNLKGMSAGRYKYYNGFGAIAYNAKHDRYAVLLRGTNFHHIMLLNSSFKPVEFLAVDENERAKQTVQGIDSYDDFVLVGQSYSGSKPNNILVYNWEGELLSRLNLSRTYELESIFHTGKDLYAGYYTSFYKYKIGKGNVLQRDNYLYKLTGY